jgi:hypothetical protein
MKKMKRKTVIAVGVVAAIIAIIVASVLVYYNNRQFSYTMLDDGTLEIKNYLGKDSEVHIPSKAFGRKVTSIGKVAFCMREDITLVEIPDTVVKIGTQAFYCCGELAIEGGENIEEIGYGAFVSCQFIEELPQWDELRIIDDVAFASASGVDGFVFGDNVEHIGMLAFDHSDVTDLNLPSSIKYIEGEAFNDTPFASKMEGYVIVNDDILISFPTDERVIVPEGIRLISNCNPRTEESDIKEFYIPDTVTMVEEILIYGTNGIRIYMPSSVEKIGVSKDFSGITTLLYGDKENVTLVCESGSYAESYAIKYNINYEIVDSVQALYEAAVASETEQ